MTDLTLTPSLAEPMRPDFPWAVQTWDLTIEEPDRFVTAQVGRYGTIGADRPWQAYVSITRWGEKNPRPTRSISWHASADEAKAAVEQLIASRP